MASKREQALSALFDRLRTMALANVKRNEALPQAVPAAGLVILRDGEPGEPDVTLNPVHLFFSHRAEIEAFVSPTAGGGGEALLDAVLGEIGAALARSVGKLARQVSQPVLCAGEDGNAVADQKGFKPKVTECADAVSQADGIVHDLLGQQAVPAGRMADQRIADDQDPAAAPEQRNLSRRLAGGGDDIDRTNPFSRRLSSMSILARRHERLPRSERRASPKGAPHQVGGAAMVAVGDEDTRGAHTHEVIEGGIAGLHGIAADVSLRMTQHMTVEVVAMRFRLPPGENIANNLLHRAFLSLSSAHC